MNQPSYDQIRQIVTNILIDTITDPEAVTEHELTEITDGIATQISRWELDTTPEPGTTAHHILNTLAGTDTPANLDQLTTEDIHLDSIAPALDNLLVAKYVESHAGRYTISPTGLRALGAAPLGD